MLQVLAGLLALPLLYILDVNWVPETLPAMLAVSVGVPIGFCLAIQAYSHEDASIVGPVLGLKAVFLAGLESAVGGRILGAPIWAAALFSTAGIALLSQRDEWSLKPRDVFRRGVALVALAALVFSVCDMIIIRAVVQWPSSLHFTLALNVLYLAVCGFCLLIWARFRRVALVRELGGPMNRRNLKAAAGALIVSAFFILLTQFLFFVSLAAGRQVTLSNILYNTRGLFVIGLMALLAWGGGRAERAGRRAYLYRALGGLLILAAVALALPSLDRLAR